jgi:hypothetical protein
VEGWGNVRKAAAYAGVSQRSFRNWLRSGLNHARLPSGHILVKFSAVDDYLKKFIVRDDVIDSIVNDVFDGIKSMDKKR